MTKQTPRFESEQDIKDVAMLLKKLNNISSGRDLVWLLEDGSANDNQEAVERWLRKEVWKMQHKREEVELNSIAQAFSDRLNSALLKLSLDT